MWSGVSDGGTKTLLSLECVCVWVGVYACVCVCVSASVCMCGPGHIFAAYQSNYVLIFCQLFVNRIDDPSKAAKSKDTPIATSKKSILVPYSLISYNKPVLRIVISNGYLEGISVGYINNTWKKNEKAY